MVIDVFSELNSRMTEGVMLHNDLSMYFALLNYKGFEELQRYRFVDETREMINLNQWFIKNYCQVLREPNITVKSYIRESDRGRKTTEIKTNDKIDAIELCINQWVQWETDSKRIYENAYTNLMDERNINAALYVSRLIECVSLELVDAYMLKHELESVNFDYIRIDEIQDSLYKKYRKKLKGVNFNANYTE